jgi:hypothetical protein
MPYPLGFVLAISDDYHGYCQFIVVKSDTTHMNSDDLIFFAATLRGLVPEGLDEYAIDIFYVARMIATNPVPLCRKTNP